MFYVSQDDDDAEFSVTSGGSKLANLFSSDDMNAEKQSPSLTYTAPKQPKKTDGTSNSTGKGLAVLHAVAVHAYKFENQEYSSQGKLGAALIGSHESSIYKILLYKGKQQQIAGASFSPHFSFKIQANNYSNFYDDKRENWSIMFDSEQNSVEFSKQVAIAKANSAGSNLNKTVVQDLVLGEGQEIGIGDAIEIKFTGWLLTNHTFGQVFDSNASSETLFRMKLGKSKVIKGWEEGLIGSRKNSRRLLIIPPSLAYGANGISDKVPPNSTLIFDIFVNKVKFSSSRDRSGSSTPSTLDSDTSDGKRVDRTPRSHAGSNAEESVRSRGVSLSEQMTHSPQSEKAKIISRMAKMGMPMLPMQGAIAAQPSSESDMEEESQQSKAPPLLPPRTSSPKLPPKPRTSSFNQPSIGFPEQILTSHATGIPPVQQIAVLQPHQQYSPGIPFGYPLHHQAGPMALYQQNPYQSSPIPDAHLPILLSETRSYNSEVRMALGKIIERFDSLVSKIEDGSHKNTGQHMESATLMQNIQRIVEENTKLKHDVDERNKKVQTLNEKISDLLQRNNKFVEESNLLLEKKSDSLQSSSALSHARLLALEQDRVKLSSELSDALSTITSLQLEMQKKEQTLTVAITGESQKHKEDVEILEKMVKELEMQVNGLQGNLNSNKSEKDHLTSTLDALKSELLEVQSSSRHLEQNLNEEKEQVEKIKIETQDELKSAKENYQKEIESIKNEVHVQQQKSQENNSWLEEKSSLTQQLTSLTEEKQTLQTEIEHLEEQVRSLTTKQESEKKSASTWKLKCEKLQDSFTQLREEYERNTRMPLIANETQALEMDLKRAMNGLYRSLQREFDKERSYNGGDALKTVLSNIRLVTVAVLEERQPQGISQDEHDTKNDGNPTEEENVNIPEFSSSESPKEENGPTEEEIVESSPSFATENSHEMEQIESKASSQDDVIKNQESGETEEVLSVTNESKNEVEPTAEDDLDHGRVDTKTMKNETTDKSTTGTGSPTTWRPQPPPPPLFDDDEDDDDWLK